MVAKATPEEVREWLEWAGERLLALPVKSPYPSSSGTSWPAFAQEAITAYGYTGERLRPARPNSEEIALMDKILLFPNTIGDVQIRRIVSARALVTPISSRYLYSWTKLAHMLHTDRRRVVRLHYTGLCEISAHLSSEKVDVMRHLLPNTSH